MGLLVLLRKIAPILGTNLFCLFAVVVIAMVLALACSPSTSSTLARRLRALWVSAPLYLIPEARVHGRRTKFGDKGIRFRALWQKNEFIAKAVSSITKIAQRNIIEVLYA